jgi:hypothetical protein
VQYSHCCLKKKIDNTHWTRFSEIIHVCIADAAVKEPSKRNSTLDTLLLLSRRNRMESDGLLSRRNRME